MKRFMNNKGFTLVELIIVIVILGVLAGVAAPKMIGTVKDARINQVVSNAEIIRNAVTAYYATNGALPADAAAVSALLQNKTVAQMGFSTYATSGTPATTVTLTMTGPVGTAGTDLANVKLAAGDLTSKPGFAASGNNVTYVFNVQ